MSAPTAQQVLDYARAEIGTRENPAGSNRVKYTDWYGMGPVAWCAIFISWLAAIAKATSIIPRHAWTPSGAAWFKARDRWGSAPRLGAIVYYNIAGLGRVSHVGIVEAVHPDGSWTAIEGNTDVYGGRTGGRVMRQHRTRVGPGGGFGYPEYGAGVPVLASPIRPNVTKPASASPLLRVGSRGEAVRTVQRAVGATADGIYGPKTRAAVQRYQRRHGLAADGIVGPNTWAVINRGGKAPAKPTASVKVPAFPGTVRRGSRGATVRAVQSRLRARGWPISVDGIYGADTEATVRAFQRDKRLAADGIAGPATWRALWTAPIT